MIAPRDVEEKVYYRTVGEKSQRQGPVGESRVDITRPNWAMRGRGRERRGSRTRCSSLEVQRFKEAG